MASQPTVAPAAPDPPAPPRDGSGLPQPRRLLAIASISLGNALVILDGAIATVALPTVARDLAVPPEAAVLVVTVYQLVLVMLLLPLSALGDRIGLRRLYQGGQFLFVAASFGCLFADSLPLLLIARAGQAAGAAAAVSVSSALLRDIYPAGSLGRGLGVNSVVVTSASALAPTVGGAILSFADWPWVFAAAAPLGLLSLAIGRALPPPIRNAEPYDTRGALLSAASFGLLLGGVQSLVHGARVAGWAVLAAGVGVTAAFVRRERLRPRPIMPLDLLGRPMLALSVVAALSAFVGSMTLILSLPFRLQHDFGFSPAEVGAMMAPWPLAMMVTSPISGTLSDRAPAGLLGAIGMGVVVTAMLLMAWLPTTAGPIDIAWRMALCGMGFSLFASPNARVVIGSAPRDRAAAAGGLLATTRITGQTLGATLVALLLSMAVPGWIAPLIAAGLALVAGLCSAARLNPAVSRPPREAIPD